MDGWILALLVRISGRAPGVRGISVAIKDAMVQNTSHNSSVDAERKRTFRRSKTCIHSG